MRIALIEELKINRDTVVRETDTIPGGGYAAPTDAMHGAYSTFTDRIGLEKGAGEEVLREIRELAKKHGLAVEV